MTADQTRLFEQACDMWNAGEQIEAVRILRDVATTLIDPEDKAGLLFHEIIWWVGLRDPRQARAQLDALKAIVSSIATCPNDLDQLAPAVTLTVMARFAEARVLMYEDRGVEALRIFEDLESQYPKQISLPAFDDIRSQIAILRGIILAGADKRAEARRFLENSPTPPGWEGIVSYELGRLHF